MKTTHPSQTNTFDLAGSRNQLHLQILAALALVALFAMTQPAGAISYTWNVSSGNWSTTNNWAPNTGPGGPHAGDSVVFGNTGASSSPFTVNNTVDLGFGGTVASLTYSDLASGSTSNYVYPGTFIPANQTLTVSTNFVVGGQSPGSGIGSFGDVLGGGTLYVTAPSFLIGNGGSSAGAIAVLDLSLLTNFVYNNTNGSIGICTNGGPLSSYTRISGTMTLASGSNYITAASLSLGTSTSAQGGAGLLTNGVFGGGVQNNNGPVNGVNPNVLTLGPGINRINARTILIANQKYGFIVANSGGGLRIRGTTGADSDANVDIIIGNRNVSGGSGQTTGWLMLNGCPVDIKANSLVVGERIPGTSNNSNGGDAGNGMVQFDNGTMSANSLLMAYNAGYNASASNPSQARGLIQVGAHGTLLIGAGQLFALASSLSNGPSTGTLIVSNGLINCQGPIVMGPGTNSIPPSSSGIATGIIQLIGAGTLNMGPNSYIGSLTNPITTLILDTDSVFSISIPSASYTNVCVQNLSWPSPDTGLTLSVAAMPDDVSNNEVFPFLNFSGTMTNTFTNPNLALPVGYTGNLSMPGNTIYLTVTGGSGPGSGGVNQLLNPFFLSGATDWTAAGSGASIVSTNSTYPNTGGCTFDTRNIVPLPDTRTGGNVAKLTGSFIGGGSTNTWSQSVPIAAGSTITAGGQTYVAHEDIMSGADSFYYELDFLDSNGALVAAYESSILTNLNCGSPILDTWNLLAVTNQMQVVGGANTGVVISHASYPARIQVPPLTVTARFKAVFIQRNATDSGSVYFSGANVGFLLPPVPPTVSSITPNQITLCTNAFLTCTASSTETTITNVQVIATTRTLGGTTTNTSTYNIGSAGLTVSGLGTSTATISLALAASTIYQSVVINATDADNLSNSSSASFDTLVPTLVIEAADFNYSSGQFMDTPSNGGLWLYQNLIGTAGVDENKNPARTNSIIYRPSDAVVIQAAAPTSATAQKFVNSADVETEVGYNSVGDWLNYTRTFGSGGSAPAGTYDVWCYLATSGSGEQASFSQVTSDRTQPNQTTIPLGQFGTSSFTDNSYNNYVYVPLVDSFGNRVSVTLTNGVQTFQSTVVGNPNLAFYLLVPKVPVYAPEFLSVYPNGPYQSTNQLSFTVGPADGAPISTNGISLILNGVTITSGLNFTQVGGNWVVTYALQSNEVYTAVINVTNTSGDTLSAPYIVNFDTFSQNNFMIEAEDFDFNSGQFIDNPVPTSGDGAGSGNLAANSYYYYAGGNIANMSVPGIDLTTSNDVAGEGFAYRVNDSCGTEITTDLLRNKFVVGGVTNTDYDVGWWVPGTWLNYTRTFPTNTYHVWGRLAAGATYNNATMSLVTSGQGTMTQSSNVLGTFSDASANGFQSWHWVPLMGTNGQPAVVSLGGVETLKVTAPPGSATGSVNANFYMFTPFVPVAAPFSISASVSGGVVSIKFPTTSGFSYTVLYSTSLNPSSWQPLAANISGDGTIKTVTDNTSGGAVRFYRAVAQ